MIRLFYVYVTYFKYVIDSGIIKLNTKGIGMKKSLFLFERIFVCFKISVSC